MGFWANRLRAQEEELAAQTVRAFQDAAPWAEIYPAELMCDEGHVHLGVLVEGPTQFTGIVRCHPKLLFRSIDKATADAIRGPRPPSPAVIALTALSATSPASAMIPPDLLPELMASRGLLDTQTVPTSGTETLLDVSPDVRNNFGTRKEVVRDLVDICAIESEGQQFQSGSLFAKNQVVLGAYLAIAPNMHARVAGNSDSGMWHYQMILPDTQITIASHTLPGAISAAEAVMGLLQFILEFEFSLWDAADSTKPGEAAATVLRAFPGLTLGPAVLAFQESMVTLGCLVYDISGEDDEATAAAMAAARFIGTVTNWKELLQTPRLVQLSSRALHL